MNIRSLFKRNKEQRSSFTDSLLFNGVGSYKQSKSMLLSTVYRCVDVISDSVAQLPIEPYFIDKEGFKVKFENHPSYYILNKEPNQYMSRFSFMKALVVSMLLKGAGYAYIDRDEKGDVKGLYFIDPNSVTITYTDNTLMDLKYSISGFGNVEPCNMIHLLNFTYDGINGVSTIQHANQTLSLSSDSEAQAQGFFKGGCNLAGILKVSSTLTEKQRTALKSSWQTAFNANSGTPNGLAVLEGNMDFQPITVNPSDAQLLETRQFNVIDICRFFGVSPVKAFDLSKASYSTVEATQLSFLTDTLSPLLEKIELEFERKIYRPSEKRSIDVRFDTSVLLRTDKKSQAEYYKSLFNIGVLSINDIRKQLDLPKVENGTHFIQCNVMTLDNAINNKPTDNKINNDEGNEE
ncbi:phage portal protein [Phocaeicola paurosaccharolyticus]|uniref:phage portal protein n=1 Tax=Phocaeicola paurosaccharolyticus TaxID=732242 RepID=UPI00046B04B9|nr:phage portal protein [Phocaeicola paurosaccharolyticus]